MADATERARDPALASLVAFGRDLRARGLPVGTGRIVTFLRAVASLGLVDRASLYWAGRVSLVASRPDLDTYDVAFDTWYRSLAPSDAELTIDSSSNAFEARLLVTPPSVLGKAFQGFRGSFAASPDHLFTAVSVSPD